MLETSWCRYIWHTWVEWVLILDVKVCHKTRWYLCAFVETKKHRCIRNIYTCLMKRLAFKIMRWSPNIQSKLKDLSTSEISSWVCPFNLMWILIVKPWWRHQMKAFSALLNICAGNSPVPGEFLAQRPVTRSFDVFSDLRLNKSMSKQWWGWWFETLLWRHCNDPIISSIYLCREINPMNINLHQVGLILLNINLLQMDGIWHPVVHYMAVCNGTLLV